MGTLITDSEIGLFHSIAQEVNRLAGIEVEYYNFNVNDMKTMSGDPGYDPLYSEKMCDSSWGITGRGGVSTEGLGKPYIVNAVYEHDEPNVSATEKGRTKDSDTQLWFAKKDFDLLGIGAPVMGAIVKYRQLFWNVTRVIGDGWIDMSHKNYSLYKLNIAYNTKFNASIRVNDPTIVP